MEKRMRSNSRETPRVVEATTCSTPASFAILQILSACLRLSPLPIKVIERRYDLDENIVAPGNAGLQYRFIVVVAFGKLNTGSYQYLYLV
jgi:hypothetical protein